MPKGLLLLILILLIGGYFLFAHGGSATEEKLPSIQLKGTVQTGESGYLVGAEGSLSLPEGDYNVNGEVWIKVNGIMAKRSSVSTVVKGPTTLPLNLPSVPVNGGDVSVGADLKVRKDDKIMDLHVEAPVTFPPKSALLLPPSLGAYVKDVSPLGDGSYEVTVGVYLYNPNDFDVKVKDVKLLFNGETYPLTFESLTSHSSSSAETTVTTDSNTLSVTVEGSVEWSGTKKSFSYPITLSFAPPSTPFPRYSLRYKTLSVKPSGISASFTVDINNPSVTPITLADVLVKVEKDGVTKEVDLGKNLTIPPMSRKELNGTINAIPFFSGGKVELLVKEGDKEETILSEPFEILPNNFIKPPKVSLWVDEVNTGAYILHAEIENPNDFNILIKGFKITEYAGDSPLNEFNENDFYIGAEDTWTYTKGDVNNPLAMGQGDRLTMTFRYGLENYNLFFPVSYSTYIDKPAS